MALGTPIARGNPWRNGGTGTLSGDTFTPSADSLLLAIVSIDVGGSVSPTMSGQDDGTAWTQILSTVLVGGNRSLSLWGCHTGSSPTSGTIDADYGTSSQMGAIYTEVPGADVSGTVADSLNDSDSGFDYSNSMDLVLSPAADLTMGFWYRRGGGTLTTGSTELDSNSWGYGDGLMKVDYDASGEAAPSCAISLTVNWGAFALDIKEAGGGGATSPKGPFTHPFYGPFRGPIS